MGNTPLSAFPKLRAATATDTERQIGKLFGGRIIALPEGAAGLNAVGNNRALSFTSTWYCSYGAAIDLDMSSSDCFRFQYCLDGAAANVCGKSQVAIGADEYSILPRNIQVTGKFDAGYRQLIFRFDAKKLEAKLSALLNAPLTRQLEFERGSSLATPQSRTLRDLARLFVQDINTDPSKAPSLDMFALENALAVKLLFAGRHNYSDLLDRDPCGVAPWQVRRAEEYIEANWDSPISVIKLASVTGVSARSLFRHFKECRGYSPLAFHKKIRLQRAEQLLRSTESKTPVTDVAFACGFGDLANFSKDFRRAFGRSPSEVLRHAQSD